MEAQKRIILKHKEWLQLVNEGEMSVNDGVLFFKGPRNGEVKFSREFYIKSRLTFMKFFKNKENGSEVLVPMYVSVTSEHIINRTSQAYINMPDIVIDIWTLRYWESDFSVKAPF